MKLKLDRKRRGAFFADCLRSPATYAAGNPLRHWGAWMRGFSSVQSVYHALHQDSFADYFPDIDRYLLTRHTNRHVWPILHDKLIFDAFMKGRLPVVEAFGCFIEGRFIPTQDGMTYDVFKDRLFAGDRYVVKPVQGGKGYGVKRLAMVEGQVQLGEQRVCADQVDALWMSLAYHIVVPFKTPHPVLSALFPASVNTLRITIFKPDAGPAQWFSPLLRVGTSRSAPMDNFSQGGMLCAIDQVSGKVYAACRRDALFQRQPVERHPDSGADLIGVQIPFWQQIRTTLNEFHDAYPCFDFVGWDVLVGENQWYLIEGNHNPDLDLPFSFTTRRAEPELDDFLQALYARNGVDT